MVRIAPAALIRCCFRLSMALGGALVAPGLAATTAMAQEASPPESSFSQTTESASPAANDSSTAPVAAPEWGPSYHHQGQFGLALMLGSSYRMIVPYKDDAYCGNRDRQGSSVCTSRGPLFMDVEGSYGISTRLDLLLALRLGLEKDFAGGRQFGVMPGLRIWLDHDQPLKFYSTIQFVYDNTEQAPTVSATDYAGRLGLGLMYDVLGNVGLYSQLGATFGFKRWFRIEADLGFGVQLRYP